MSKPNILFLFSDQHNARCLSCAGHPDVQTPNLDRLAAAGVRFTSAYTQNPICTPSRMSFLSGLYPSTHGYYGLYGHPPQEPVTSMFRHFRQLGYRTGALGKLHTPRYWIEADCQTVYDEFIEFPKYLEGAGLYEQNDNRKFIGDRSGQTSPLPLEHSCEVALTKQTVRFLRNEGEPADRGDAQAPWFAWVSFSRPHEPWTPSEPFASMYPPESVNLPPVSPDEKQVTCAQRAEHSEEGLRRLLSAYLGLVSQVDYGIGLILAELERAGMLKNTIIVYSADHGDYAGEHGLIEKRGGISYRAITRIPLIVCSPGQAEAGIARTEIVEAVDVFPTLCALAGLEPPATLQGLSFEGLLNGAGAWPRSSALTENPYRKALSTGRWRYVANLYGEEEDELYDGEADPWELHNLAADPGYREIALTLQRTLLDRVARARKPINTINGFWHQHAYDEDGRIDLHKSGPTNAYW